MIDIVTVVFGEELHILKCQAQSLELYGRELEVGKIFVMINEADLADKIDISWYGNLASRVYLITREEFDVDWSTDGWVNQQLLKMLGGIGSQSTWSMILDAKTVLTRSLSETELFTPLGQIRLGWMPTIGVFQPAQTIANQLFETDNNRTLAPVGVPFFFHNQSLRIMVDFIQGKTGQDFKRWFLDQGQLTEFVLYSTWVSLDPVRKALYEDSLALDLRICNICHSQADHFDSLLALHDDQTHTLSIHRRAWSKLSEEQKQSYRQRLIARGISRANTLI